MEGKLLCGGKNIVDHTNEQQKALEQRKREIAEQKRREREMQQKLEEQEEAGINLQDTYTSLQQEVEIKTKKLKKVNFISIAFIGGSLVTLVVSFGLLPQKFGRWWGTTNITLSFYDCRFIDGESHTLSYVKKFNFLHSQLAGTQKLWVQMLAELEIFSAQLKQS